MPENQGVEKKRWQKWHLKTCKTKAKNLYREDAKKHRHHATLISWLGYSALGVFSED